jgi:hypothetical protein
MWQLWKQLRLVNQIGVVGALLGFLVGMGAVLAAGDLTSVIIVVACVGLLVFCFWFFFHDQVRSNRLAKTGEPAYATILDVEETGVTVQGNYPQAKLRLLVEKAGCEPYEATTRCQMNRFDVPAMQPGARISVVVDRRHPKKVAVL